MNNKLIRLAVLAAGFWSLTWAQDPDNGPGRGVARISLINGDVSVRRGDSGDWTAAAVNAPLVVEDRVVTGPNSRTELQFDWANMLRVSHNAEVRLAELEHQRFMVQLARGTVTWSVLRDQDAYVEISTPSVSVRPVKRGMYRVTVNEDGSSEITVRSGEAEIFTPRGSERLRDNRTMYARGSQADPEFRTSNEIPEDEWDRWNERRNRDLLRTQSYNYISRDIYGADDLDHHGRWVYVGNYGWCWSPRVAVGWAPYRHGRWSWIDWYGWSWVSYDPWGWAPYHYGRWFHHGPYGWVWHPGAIGVRHRWAPAHVAFFGFGGVGVGFGWGRVGWIPLAPYEPFNPWWGSRWYGGYRNRTYIDNSVTVVNNVNITNVYRNSRVQNGTTVIDGDGFRHGRAGQAGRFSDAEWRQASVAQGPVPVTPGRESLRLSDREASIRSADSRGSSDRFFSARQPTRVDRVSFDDQQRGVEQIARRAYDGGAAAGSPVRGSDGSSRQAVSGAGATSAPVRGSDGTGGGWRSVDSGRQAPAAAAGGARSERSDEAGRGWRSVGENPSAPSSAPVRGSASGGNDSGGSWQRFGSARVSEGRDSGRGARDAAPSGRFGEPSAPASGSSFDSGAGARGSSGAAGRSSSDGWTRFGSGGARGGDSGSGAAPSASPSRGESRGSEGRGSSDGGSSRWGGFSGGGRGSSASPSAAPDRRGGDDGGSSGGRGWSGSRGSGGGESIRINPPIVRERSMPSMPSGGGGGGRGMSDGGGGGRSAPSGAPPSGGGGGGRGGDGGGGGRSGGGGGRGR